MRRPISVALLLGAALLLMPTGSVVADEPGSGISVEPSDVTAGQTILLAGNGLEPNNERVLVLQGEAVTVSLGTATTDANGMLNQEITIPGHLPSGVYQLQAIGDETLAVDVNVTAAAGGAAPPPADAAITARSRGPIELGAVLLGVVLAAVVGTLLVLRAERLGAAHRA